MLDFFIQFFTDLLNVLKGQKQEPERPNNTPPISTIREPKFVVVPGVQFKTYGRYKTKSGNAKGLVVHYTVSGRTSNSAKSVLRYLANNGLGCMVMDEDGVIYVPENFNFQNTVAFHAGTSMIHGFSGVSYYCMGMEICNWGRLDGTTRKNVGDDFRLVKLEDNIVPGEYQPYTQSQEDELINFCLWQKSINPEFDYDWVIGHDECAQPKGRKTDPGGSLSFTMPVFRNMLKSR